ncbi:unnamed protein product [Phytophthora lilii]|uniref:Unnamed protein product n=1 Tax=Phytophthora lilii TaxID=2077276 RepID=A0A9W7D8J1_9STRA|nr:unnamed protein product [Phytophthora lilii]
MPTKGEGAIGALDFPAEERKRLAKLCEACGRVADLLPELESEGEGAEAEKKPSKYAEQIAQLHMHSLEKALAPSAAKDQKEAANTSAGVSDSGKTEASAAQAEVDATQASATIQETSTVDSNSASTKEAPTLESASPTDSSDSAPATATEPAVPVAEPAEAADVAEPLQNVDIAAHNVPQVRESDSVDTFLHYLTVAIVVALFALIYKKLLQMHGVLQ